METTAGAEGAIILAVDGSGHADRAVEWAAAQAALEHRRVVVVHVAVVPAWAVGEYRLMEARVDADAALLSMHRTESNIAEEVADRVRQLAPGVEVSATFRVGDPRKALLDLSERAAMVVLGSRGLGPVRSLLIGSVTSALVRHGKCPVVVVRPDDGERRRHGMLVGTDGGPESLPILEYACRLASQRQLPLTVLLSHGGFGSAPDGWEEAERLLVENARGLREKFPDVHIALETAFGPPENELVSRGSGMDLVVVGRRERTLLERLHFSSSAASVVEHSNTTVAVVPLGERQG